MFFKGRTLKTAGCIWLIMNCHFSFVSIAKEGPSSEIQSLTLVPNKCIALRKGRECFATIKIQWQTKKIGNYCLRRVSDQLAINCWQSDKQGAFSYIFNSSSGEQLALVREHDNQVLAVSGIKVSWVYKSNKRRKRWRVF